MYFTTGPYFIFLMAVFFGYWALDARPRLRLAFLAVASCFFYSMTGVRGILLLIAVSAVDFTTTSLMAGAETGRRRRLLFISLSVDICTLCVFKYADFFIESGVGALSLVGITLPLPAFEIAAPVGISFLIFQSTAYVIDVYRRDTEPARRYLDYLAFLSFFPTIVAGPILRARQLLPHLRRAVVLDASSGGAALFLIAIGLIKKIAIGDYLSANLVDRVFDFPERFSSLEVLAAIYGYAFRSTPTFPATATLGMARRRCWAQAAVELNAPTARGIRRSSGDAGHLARPGCATISLHHRGAEGTQPGDALLWRDRHYVDWRLVWSQLDFRDVGIAARRVLPL
jgi:D-alanyl-lipoteichoic acid acyltransferase DltB (MBOAT superfamily)